MATDSPERTRQSSPQRAHDEVQQRRQQLAVAKQTSEDLNVKHRIKDKISMGSLDLTAVQFIHASPSSRFSFAFRSLFGWFSPLFSGRRIALKPGHAQDME